MTCVALDAVMRCIDRGALRCACCAAPRRRAAAPRREYRTIEVESLRITIDSDWAPRAAPGYLPVRFDITNLGEARVIEIVGAGDALLRGDEGRGRLGGIRGRAQALRLARGDRVRLTIPVPIFADSENIRFEIREDGRTLERFNYTGFQSGSRPDDASALIVADPASAFGSGSRWPRKITGGRRIGGRPPWHRDASVPARRTVSSARQQPRCLHWISCSSPARCRPTGSGSRRCARSSSARQNGSS